MNKIIIIGLGTNSGDLSLSAYREVKSGKKIVLKTEKTIASDFLREENIQYLSLDYIYEKSRNFENLNKNLASEVIRLAKTQPILYLVDGDILIDTSAKMIIAKHKDTIVFNGVSKASYFQNQLKENSYSLVSAYDIKEKSVLTAPLIVYDIDSRFLASDVKDKLLDIFGEEKTCVLHTLNGERTISLYELDWEDEFDYQGAIYIAGDDLTGKDRYDFYDLIEILKVLRGKNGCPWDRAQTHESIRMNLIEEAYELVDAIDLKDEDKIREEAGDVILQGAFHMLFSEESGSFTVNDSITELCKKLIFRHSHIFKGEQAETSADALNVWEKNKNIEKKFENYGDTLKDLPKCFPALLRAEKVQKRASKSGFEFCDDEISNRIIEKLKDFLSAENEKQVIGGELLFELSYLMRNNGIKSELALKETTDKFIDSFCEMEKLILEDGFELKNLSIIEMKKYWNKVVNQC